MIVQRPALATRSQGLPRGYDRTRTHGRVSRGKRQIEATEMGKLTDYNESEVLTFNSLLALLGRRSRQSIYDLIKRDPSFPRPRQIGSEFSVGWLRGEVMEWLNSRPPAELNGLDAVERRRRAWGSRPAWAGRGKLALEALLVLVYTVMMRRH